jgi:hypothetical protein
MTATELEDRKQADRDRKQLQRDRAKARVLLTESGTPRQEAERLVRDMSRDSVCDILRDMSRDMSRDVTPRADTRVRPPTRDPSPAQPSPTQPFAAAAREAIDQPEDDPGEPTDSQVRSVVPEPGAVAAPVAGFGAARLHLELPAIEPKLSEAPGAIQRPRNLEEALKLPIGDRARFVEAEPHIAEWLQPDKWPGVQAFAREVSEALNMTQTPLGAYKRDSGVRAIVALYAQFSKEQLEQAITAMASDEWLKSKRGGLSILTPEVVRRLLQGPAKPRRPQRQPDNGGGYSVADAYAAQQKAHA